MNIAFLRFSLFLIAPSPISVILHFNSLLDEIHFAVSFSQQESHAAAVPAQAPGAVLMRFFFAPVARNRGYYEEEKC
jgi:hypothetical protein